MVEWFIFFFGSAFKHWVVPYPQNRRWFESQSGVFRQKIQTVAVRRGGRLWVRVVCTVG